MKNIDDKALIIRGAYLTVPYTEFDDGINSTFIRIEYDKTIKEIEDLEAALSQFDTGRKLMVIITYDEDDE